MYAHSSQTKAILKPLMRAIQQEIDAVAGGAQLIIIFQTKFFDDRIGAHLNASFNRAPRKTFCRIAPKLDYSHYYQKKVCKMFPTFY